MALNQPQELTRTAGSVDPDRAFLEDQAIRIAAGLNRLISENRPGGEIAAFLRQHADLVQKRFTRQRGPVRDGTEVFIDPTVRQG